MSADEICAVRMARATGAPLVDLQMHPDPRHGCCLCLRGCPPTFGWLHLFFMRNLSQFDCCRISRYVRCLPRSCAGLPRQDRWTRPFAPGQKRSFVLHCAFMRAGSRAGSCHRRSPVLSRKDGLAVLFSGGISVPLSLVHDHCAHTSRSEGTGEERQHGWTHWRPSSLADTTASI